jgi:O-antigen ligase
VGFFSNANHFGIMLLTAMPMLAALLAWHLPDANRAGFRMLIVAAYAIIALIAVSFAQTIAGFVLLVPSLGASLLIAAARSSKWAKRGALVLPVIAIAALLAGAYHSQTNALAEAVTTEPEGRISMARNTAEAISSFWPVGTGMGSFSAVYPLFEDASELSLSYANRAHNDYLELTLEAGIFGLALIAAFVLWWLFRSVVVWRDPDSSALWAKAGSAVTGILLAHSLVDYPLRTPALAAVFTLGALLLAGAAARERRAGVPIHLSL